jgi:hypothetical protein
MKRLGLSCYALAMGAPGAMQAVGKNSARHRAPRYAVLFSFDETDGASPSGGLLNVDNGIRDAPA